MPSFFNFLGLICGLNSRIRVTMSDATPIKTEIFAAIIELIGDKPVSIADETPLIGDGSVLDSMKLVQLCVSLEDKATELGFDFDWTSDTAMSKSRSIFRTANSLATEFINQMESDKK